MEDNFVEEVKDIATAALDLATQNERLLTILHELVKRNDTTDDAIAYITIMLSGEYKSKLN